MVAEFATVVGLISQFRSERAGQAQADFNEFITWLMETNHSELKANLELNTRATVYIKALLNEDHKLFKEKLEKIDSALTAFASTVGGFAELAQSIKPEAVLSEQALSILNQFEAAEASRVVEVRYGDACVYQFMDGFQRRLDITENRFVEDDLKSMVGIGLLRHEISNKGNNVYCFTRVASQLVQARS